MVDVSPKPEPKANVCPEGTHAPRQHYDNKQAWCDLCGMNAYRRPPRDFTNYKSPTQL